MRVVCASCYLQPMTKCRLPVLPSDSSPQFFYTIRANDDSCFCLESTSWRGGLVCVENSRVFLKNTTTNDFNTHFTKHSVRPMLSKL